MSKPILFKGPMVVAVNDDVKVETRRIVSPCPGDRKYGGILMESTDKRRRAGNALFYRGDNVVLGRDYSYSRCQQGKIGDELWIKETWRTLKTMDDLKPTELPEESPIQYAADMHHTYEPSEDPHRIWGRWRPSIFMRKIFSRTSVIITGTGVERIQDITPKGALAEGICEVSKDGIVKKYCVFDRLDHSSTPWSQMPSDPITAFQQLWDSINSKPRPVKTNGKLTHYVSYPWESGDRIVEYRGFPWYVFGNAYVWKIRFERKK